MTSRICSECGYALALTDKTCPECGAPVYQAAFYCSECGRELLPGETVCSGCGAPINADNTPPAAETDSINVVTLCALIFAFLMPPAGLVLSIIGLKKLPKADHGKCLAALIISIIMTAAITVFCVIYLPKIFGLVNTGSRIKETLNSFLG